MKVDKRLRERLNFRFAMLVRYDSDTAGFWHDVAKAFGTTPDMLTQDQSDQALTWRHRVADKLKKG